MDPNNLCTKYILSSAAAGVAETATFPLDLTKTRLQIQGELTTYYEHPYRGMVATASGIVREEGFFKLWQGCAPAIFRHFIYSGIRVVIYEELRDDILPKQADGRFSMTSALIAGAVGGLVGQFVASPTDLVKVRMQMEGRRKVLGLPQRYAGSMDVLLKTFARSGLQGLWKGWVPNCQRAVINNTADFVTYDATKHFLLRHTRLHDNIVTHSISSIIAALVTCVATTPVDVIKTRIMNQEIDSRGRGVLYKSSYDCITKTLSQEGLSAFYKGFVPMWMRLSPWVLIFWVTYEQLRRAVGTSSF